MRETYTCLSEHLQSLFLSLKITRALDFSDGMDITKPDIISILKRFNKVFINNKHVADSFALCMIWFRIRLLNEFQREVPSIWVRYPEYFLETVVESTLSICALKPKTGDR